MNSIKDRVKALRNSRGLNQTQLGDAIGLAFSSISAIENGRSESRESIIAIAKYFKVDANWIITGEGEQPKGLIVPIRKKAEAHDWKDEAYTALKEENQRLWRLIEKITNAPAGSIANFKQAVGLAGKQRSLQLTAQAA